MKPSRTTIELFSAAFLGLACIVVPVMLDPSTRQYEAAFLPFIKNTVEGIKMYSLIFLIPLGVLYGYFGKNPFWLIGPMTVVLLPMWSLIDMIMGGSHNLLPIEWVIYGLYSLPGLLGAFIGDQIKRFVSRKR